MRSLSVLGCFVLSLFANGLFAAEPAEQPWLNLLNPESLVGWDYGESTAGWSMKEGVLSFSSPKDQERNVPLKSGYTVGDFELEYATQGDEAAAKLFLLPQNDDSEFRERVYITLQKAGRILRQGTTLKITTPVGETEVEFPPLKGRVRLVIESQKPSFQITKLKFREPVGEPLFNGKDLTGWYTPGKKTAWHVEKGMIVKQGGGGNYLRTEQEFGNFTLSLDYKMSKGNNSGIGIRTPRGGWPSSDGMELQLLDRPGLSFGSNMSIYRNVPPLAAAHESEKWNHCVIKADGYIISAWINGQLVQHANTLAHPELKFRHLKGWIGFQDHGGIAEFKNIHLLEAPEYKTIAEWRKPKPANGAELVLDRLMNPQAIAQQPQVKSRVVEASAASREETVLADLNGPGALVGLTAQAGDGTLAFYFDDETNPRFTEPVRSLHNKLPKLTDQKHPLVTYAPYKKRLKIVQLSGKSGRYLLEYVTFPSEAGYVETMGVESMGDLAESIPRGWRASIDYRHHHYNHGQHRENDPQPRAGEQNKTIEPGSAVPLLTLEGAGSVQWWKLRVNSKLLENDDLWLEITVDGEAQPAIAAPARFLFAPVADGHKHNNFLFTNSGGLFSRLAMPYQQGISILAKNKGRKPLKGIGLTASYLPAKDTLLDKEIPRMRLRATFLSAQDPAAKVVGSGRVVGVVLGLDQGKQAPRLGELLIDGSPLPGWRADTFNLLMGFKNPDEAVTRRIFSGHTSQLAWRYFVLAPPEFDKELTLETDPSAQPELVLYYLAKP